jgi:teichuronic acid biosynthesis glycosyltransferase TuaC
VHVVTFSNLFPSSVMPTHGVFVLDRMQRVAKAGGFRWSVVAPVPHVPWPLRRGIFREWAKVPLRETFAGVDVHHPRFRHLPGLSMRRQAQRVAHGARRIVRELVADGPAVLDAHYLWPDGVAAAQLAEECGVPFVLTARGSDVNVLAEDKVIGKAIGDAARAAHACWAVSEALAERFAAVAGLPAERVPAMQNGVDLERFRPGDAAAARRQLGLPSEGALVLGVGRFVPGKGFVDAARAVARLDGVQLVLVGDGEEHAAIEAALPGRVLFLGKRSPDEVAAACRAADVLVLPSEREGWPNVVTEALASGLPVVATPVGGIPEILGTDPPPSRGALVPVHDVDALTAALRTVLATPRDRDGVRRFAERYGWQPTVDRLVAAFRAAGERTA